MSEYGRNWQRARDEVYRVKDAIRSVTLEVRVDVLANAKEDVETYVAREQKNLDARAATLRHHVATWSALEATPIAGEDR